MTDNNQFKSGKSAIDAANAAAHNLSKDAGVKGNKGPVDAKVTPHASGGTGPKVQENLTCPRCGKSTLRAEFPDQYEVWTKCSSCSFFMGMSNDDWHRMENSPNISEKIKKMAAKQGRLSG